MCIVTRLTLLTVYQDIYSRRGLKEVHNRFEEVCDKLGDAYATAYQSRETATQVAVLAIWAILCTDVVLCRQLVSRGDLPSI